MMSRGDDRKNKHRNPEYRGDALVELETLGRVSQRSMAALLDVHYYTMRDRLNEGLVNGIQIGSRWWIPIDEVIRLLEPSEHKPGSLVNRIREIRDSTHREDDDG